jgi:hypothetical protein
MLKNTTIISLLRVSGCNDVDKHECTTQAKQRTWSCITLQAITVTARGNNRWVKRNLAAESRAYYSSLSDELLSPTQLNLKHQMNCCTNS